LKEIEVKILEINVEKTEKKLKEMGAEKVFDGKLINIYFDFPDKRLEKEGKVLRLRKKDDKVILTFKKLITQKEAKIMDEYEVEVKDFGLIKEIFEGIELLPIYEFIKHRKTYELNQTHFEIDKYPEIPPFLEIEAPDLQKVYEMIPNLGFSKEDVNSYSIKDVLEYYGKIR